MMTLEQLGILHRVQLEAWLALTEEAVSGVDKVIGLNLQAIKAGFGETEQCLHAAADARDTGEWLSAHVRYLQPLGERVSGYARNLVEIGVQTQTGIAKALQRHGDEVRRQWSAVTENFVDSAPPGSEAVLSLMKAAVGWEVAAAEVAEEVIAEEMTGKGG